MRRGWRGAMALTALGDHLTTNTRCLAESQSTAVDIFVHDTRSTRPKQTWSSCLRAFEPTPARKACARSHTPVPYAHSM